MTDPIPASWAEKAETRSAALSGESYPHARLVADDLRDLGACISQVALFGRLYPDGVTCPDAATVQAALRAGLNVDWLARALAPAPLWAEYKRRCAPLLAKYERQREKLWDECERQHGALWAEYARRRAPLWDEYERRRAELLTNLFAAVWPSVETPETTTEASAA